MAKTKHFGTDTHKILEILTHRLYSENDIFLKELISNSSDACNKMNFLITNGEYTKADYNKKIFINCDESNHTLTIIDNGIGMNDEDMDKFLGTIASSHTQTTLEKLSSKGDLIGQFGIGFYSCFMVADEVKVWSKKYNSSKKYLWSSNGKESYEIIEQDEPLMEFTEDHGTQIQLKLKEDFHSLTNKYNIRETIKKYSNYIAIPIIFFDEQDKNESINQGMIPWRGNVTDDVAHNIYKTILNGMGDIFHYSCKKLEGVYNYTRLLFIPSKSFFVPITRDHKPDMHIYVNGVFVCNDQTFLPLYLRFIKGIIEFEDLPINISRETFLQNSFVQNTKNSVKKAVLNELIHQLEKNPEEYIEKFWNVYGNILKEGLVEDYQDKTMIFDCCLFKSYEKNKLITIKEYVESIKNEGKEEDNNLYYFLHKQEGSHPMVENFIKKHNRDVLILKDELEKICLENAHNYSDKTFMSITEQQDTYEITEEEKSFVDLVKTMVEDIQDVKLQSLDNDTIGFIIKEQNLMVMGGPGHNTLTINVNNPFFKKLMASQSNPQQLQNNLDLMVLIMDLKDRYKKPIINDLINKIIKEDII